ncbi:hypothetical protein RFI_14485 [Reticulomyxa filosa]|uniref:Uncharacterized protein n=1 Tax=Reticulomyxa filosa TaxID=46433 RepID=X6NAC0_RETFI|nr:hypothetical protein RFI_14485 [Reticulomyxa filosa]|eukprot:ETO22714.1 hypothetical protein RFI_14485 [Reticulomyxa filosa]
MSLSKQMKPSKQRQQHTHKNMYTKTYVECIKKDTLLGDSTNMSISESQRKKEEGKAELVVPSYIKEHLHRHLTKKKFAMSKGLMRMMVLYMCNMGIGIYYGAMNGYENWTLSWRDTKEMMFVGWQFLVFIANVVNTCQFLEQVMIDHPHRLNTMLSTVLTMVIVFAIGITGILPLLLMVRLLLFTCQQRLFQRAEQDYQPVASGVSIEESDSVSNRAQDQQQQYDRHTYRKDTGLQMRMDTEVDAEQSVELCVPYCMRIKASTAQNMEVSLECMIQIQMLFGYGLPLIIMLICRTIYSHQHEPNSYSRTFSGQLFWIAISTFRFHSQLGTTSWPTNSTVQIRLARFPNSQNALQHVVSIPSLKLFYFFKKIK